MKEETIDKITTVMLIVSIVAFFGGGLYSVLIQNLDPVADIIIILAMIFTLIGITQRRRLII